MSAITWDHVLDFEASVSTVPLDAQTAILAHVNAHLYVANLDGEDGPTTRLARIYLAAHHGLGAVPGAGGAGGGPVASESGGDGLSVSYAITSSAMTSGALGETSWGRKYLALVRPAFAGPAVL